MAIITVEEVKTLLSIPGDDVTKDDVIETMIPIVEDFVKRHCNDEFTDDEGVTSFPGGLKLPAAQLIGYQLEYKGVAGESIGDYSVSFFANIPDGIKTMLKPYKKLRFV